MKKYLTPINILFAIQLILVGLVITGVLSRSIILLLAFALALYVSTAPLENTVIFFTRSMPFFVAIPITASFDSLNTWRILSVVIFIRWFFQKEIFNQVSGKIYLLIKNPAEFFKRHQAMLLGFLILIMAILSISRAQSHTIAVKRIIYFVNLSLVGVVAFDLIKKSALFGERLIKNIAIPAIFATLIGLAQLISAYYMDIFQFVDFWAGKVELGLFGHAWANTAIKANTWFAYFGDQLSLRMFSIFPDSHSFPIFLLLGLPAVLTISLPKIIEKGSSLKQMFMARASLWIIFVPFMFLAAILSGTRGIWAASIPVLFVIAGIIFWLRKRLAPIEQKNIFKYISVYILLFFMLFGVAYPIFASNQFMISKNDSALFAKRVRSIIDIAETSNSQRIQIWKASIGSIIKRPLLGVGIGNFPVVLGQDLALAKAGSSAHNLYLNIAAEMGIPTLIFILWWLWLLLKKTFDGFLDAKRSVLNAVYSASALIFIPWVLFYSLTDAAIFDERAFLIFALNSAMIFGLQ